MLRVCRGGDPCSLRRDDNVVTTSVPITDAYREKLVCRPIDAIRLSSKTIPAVRNATPLTTEAFPKREMSWDRYAFATTAQTHRYMETIQHATQSLSFRILSGMN